MKQIFFILIVLLPICAYSQLQEEFNGPDITSAFPWKGELNQFVINSEGMLQLQAKGAANTAYIHIGFGVFHANEWHFRLKTDYKGTTQNHAKVYIWSQDPEIENPRHAVYIHTGSGNNSIALCYQNGQNTYVLHEGRSLFKEKQEVEIRVVTDENGICSYYTKCIGEEAFTKEGEGELNLPHNVPGYFILSAKYSSTHTRDMYYDDIYITRFTERKPEPDNPDNPDNPEEPEDWLEILAEYQESPFEIIILFDRSVIIEDASFLLSEIGEADRKLLSENRRILTLQWDIPMQYEKEYTLNYDGIHDGNQHEYGGSFTFISSYDPRMYVPAAEGAVIINEVMADPKGLTQLPETEYVELYNTTNEPQLLKGWRFVYDKTEVELPDFELPAGGYVILHRSGRDIQVDSKGYSLGLDKFPAQLANTGKAVGLKDHTDKWIDQIAYPKAKPGVSHERQEEGWYLSTDKRGGTPGAANSDSEPDNPEEPSEPEEPEEPVTPDPEEPEQPEKPDIPQEQMPKPFDIVFNEILPEPYEGGSEYIELYNRSERSLSLSGLAISTRKNDSSLSTRYSLAAITSVLKPGGYALLTKNAIGVTGFYVVEEPDNLHEVKLPALANTTSTLVLYRTDNETVIDEVRYTSKWHASFVKDPKGVSLERIDPDKDSRAGDNWMSATSTAGYGTPGYQNSQYGIPDPGDITGIEIPEFNPFTNSYDIKYFMSEAGYTCRIWVYNLSGVKMAEIANQELLGTAGTLFWDGTGRDGRQLLQGLYVFYAELTHPLTGDTMRVKKVFLVK